MRRRVRTARHRSGGGSEMGESKTWGPFTGRQLTVIIVALIAGVVMLPGVTWAVDAFSNVAVEDPVSGVKAQVDATRHLVVGDGSGALTVDGTVSAMPSTAKNPFLVNGISFTDGLVSAQFAPTSATIAVTGLHIANVT